MFVGQTSAVIDFYVDADQTELLYGVKSDGIFYIQDGMVNHYAMTFQNQVWPVTALRQFRMELTTKKNFQAFIIVCTERSPRVGKPPQSS